ncbi:hypothetical protein SAMN06264364_13726 [Quadrisphaera granulorum]|uniref:Uncharacterized protein n=1 Tax=Quadrisphaera granulorum TaxID=317664 RepID=A0A315ZQV1_9ACTN|nr:hypothetical protein [Quadrisphaera granulorum]PWJ47483.1 hypothetical protein BXY45_13726 [Quadrisphaera granulorum]SZE98784.1 hypothetical protein SAMN06264364_13726 [Quadrisphaera granulorum]
MSTASTQRSVSSQTSLHTVETPVRQLPALAQLQLPSKPVSDRMRTTVTAAAMRETLVEWLEDAGPVSPKALRDLAVAAHVPYDVVRGMTRRDATGVIPPGLAARLLWAMGEPLRPDLRQALADDLAAEAA